MLSQTSTREILRKLESQVGHPINEADLSLNMKRAVSNLAAVQRHIWVISEVLRGESSRVQRNAFLSFASRLHKDEQREAHSGEVQTLQAELNSKISEVSAQILQEDIARQSGQLPPTWRGNVETIRLKCPSCGADLPMPTGRFIECQFCKTTLSIQDVSSQMKTAIQGI
jgi:hypothetical protein